MPLAKIPVVEGRYDEARIAKVSGAIQAALMNTLRVPPEDFYSRATAPATRQRGACSSPRRPRPVAGRRCPRLGASGQALDVGFAVS
jgi:hypothetical protein